MGLKTLRQLSFNSPYHCHYISQHQNHCQRCCHYHHKCCHHVCHSLHHPALQEAGLRDHVKAVELPEMEFDPKKEKSAKKVFKLISFEFAHAEDENDGIPELGLSTFQVRIQLNTVSMLIFPKYRTSKHPNSQSLYKCTVGLPNCRCAQLLNC